MDKVIDVDIIEDDRDKSEKRDFIPPEVLYDELIEKVKKYHPSADVTLIKKAYQIAYDAHKGAGAQVRGTLYSSNLCGDHSGRSGIG